MTKSAISLRTNPIIERYITSDLSLQEIIRSSSSNRADSPCAKALLLISECLAGKRLAKDAITAAENAPLKSADSELQTLLMSKWAELSCRIGRPREAATLLHQAKSQINDNTHPLIRGAVLLAESTLADTTGNQSLHESILRDTLNLIDSHSPRRKFYLWELALLLASQGRGSELSSQMRELTWQCNENFPLSRLLAVQFINAVETAHIQEASTLMAEIATSGDHNPKQPLFAEHQTLLALMHAGTSLKVHPERERVLIGTDNISQNEDHIHQTESNLTTLPRSSRKDKVATKGLSLTVTLPTWAQVVQHLLNNDSENALKTAQLEAKRKLSTIFKSGFCALNLVRAELSCRHHEAARRLLAMRHARGNRHYLDDFFTARAELIAGNRREARRAFRRVLDASKQYDARGRLDFEMKLSSELTPGDIVTLSKRPILKQKNRIATSGSKEYDSFEPENSISSGYESKNSIKSAKMLEPAFSAPRSIQTLLGRSRVMQEIRETIEHYADLDAPVVITGETGTGKDIIARALHQESSRSKKPFVAINCGTITESLLESELFGHEKGSFTGASRHNRGLFEEAGGGTIFLDEIGEVSPRLQVALLRVLETGEIRAIGSSRSRTIKCRVIAATHANLHQRIEQGLFRQDLMYRLERLLIHIPPLRERPDDIMLLVRHFIDIGREVGTRCTVNKAFVDTVRRYEWPGNVRELRNVIERMRLTHSDKLHYTEKDLDIRRAKDSSSRTGETRPAPLLPRPQPATRPETVTTQPRTDDQQTNRPMTNDQQTNIAEFIKSGNSQLRRTERIKDLFNQHKRLTRAEIVHIIGVSPNTATKYLKNLCAEEFIQRIEPTASTRTHYFELVDKQRPLNL